MAKIQADNFINTYIGNTLVSSDESISINGSTYVLFGNNTTTTFGTSSTVNFTSAILTVADPLLGLVGNNHPVNRAWLDNAISGLGSTSSTALDSEESARISADTRIEGKIDAVLASSNINYDTFIEIQAAIAALVGTPTDELINNTLTVTKNKELLDNLYMYFLRKTPEQVTYNAVTNQFEAV
jgi:hypothetical protein